MKTNMVPGNRRIGKLAWHLTLNLLWIVILLLAGYFWLDMSLTMVITMGVLHGPFTAWFVYGQHRDNDASELEPPEAPRT